jgi:hypothetical protein
MPANSRWDLIRRLRVKGLNVPSLFINFAFHNKPRICILVRTAPAYFERRLRLKCDATIAETRFRLSAKRTSPFKSVGESVQSTTGRRAVHISLQGLYCSCASLCSVVMWRLLAAHSILLFPLHFPSRASPCAITFQLDSTKLRDFSLSNLVVNATPIIQSSFVSGYKNFQSNYSYGSVDAPASP